MPKVGRTHRATHPQWQGGTKSLPTAVKKLRGTLRPGRVNKAEPQVPAGIPKRPPWLKDRISIGLWKELAYLLGNMRVLTVADTAALCLLCSTYAEWRRASEIVRTEGFTYEVKTREGEVTHRRRPEVEAAANAAERLRRLLVEFGLTPSSRVKVHAVDAQGQPTEDQLDEELFGSN